MATTTTFARNVTIQAGTHTYPDPTSSPDGVAIPAGPLTCTVDASTVPATTTFTLAVFFWNGAAWQQWGASDFTGGTAPNPHTGQQDGTHTLSGTWPGGNAQLIVTVSATAKVSVSATEG